MQACGQLTLSIALSDNERTRPILQGAVQAQGVTFIPTSVHPSEMFWRQLKFREFDISEMSLASLFIATAQGNRDWIALPVYTTRYFFHTRIIVRGDRQIAAPGDLQGKRIGVPEYQQTAAVWSRGILEHEFGVAPQDIEWFMERGPDKSHGAATGFAPPPGVHLNQIPRNSNIGEMLVNGDLDGTLLYLPERNLVDRSTIDISQHATIRPLFSDVLAETRRFYAKTGIYPINHAVVIRRSLYEKHPWLPVNLYHAFVEAKRQAERDTIDNLRAYLETGVIDANVQAALRSDPKAYGMAASRQVVETISQYVHEQGLTDRYVSLEELFAPSLMDV